MENIGLLMTLLNIEYVRLRTVNLEIFLDIYVTRGHQLRFRIFRSTKTFSLFCAQFENTHQILHQISRVNLVSIPFSLLMRQWYVRLPLDTGTLIGLSLKITSESIMCYAMNLQRHTQKLFTSLSCVLLSLVLFLVIAFQISDLTFNDYITWFESVEVVFRKSAKIFYCTYWRF